MCLCRQGVLAAHMRIPLSATGLQPRAEGTLLLLPPDPSVDAPQPQARSTGTRGGLEEDEDPEEQMQFWVSGCC